MPRLNDAFSLAVRAPFEALDAQKQVVAQGVIYGDEPSTSCRESSEPLPDACVVRSRQRFVERDRRATKLEVVDVKIVAQRQNSSP